MSHHCPICRNIVPRKEARTCGGVDCVANWRTLTSSQKAKYLELAESSFTDDYIMPIDTTQPTISLPKESSPDPKEIMESIFGKKGR